MSDPDTLRIVIPDLISPSYFPMIAAVELGCIADRGTPAELSLHFPVTSAVSALCADEVDIVAGASHAMFHESADTSGVRLLAALSQRTYWFLVVRSNLGISHNAELNSLHGLRIGAAPGPDAGLRQMLVDAGVDPATVEIGPVPGAATAGISFGVTAVEALAAGGIDGFWANGMGAELAVRKGLGTVVVDARRGDGPATLPGYTFSAVMSTERFAQARPEALDAVVAGVLDAQARLRADPSLSTTVAQRVFPPMETELIATLIARDAPYYDPAITEDAVASMVQFAQRCGLTTRSPGFDDLVSPRYRALWGEAA